MNLSVRLASTLLALGHIPHEHAKQLSALQIISLYQWDHYPIRKADGGPDEPWNLRPLMIAPHREKTAKHDAPDMAHERKVSAAHEDFRRRLLAKDAGEERTRSRWARGRKVQKQRRSRYGS